ncbi:MAG: type II secretion system F family protein [Desulfovibrio sp.]
MPAFSYKAVDKKGRNQKGTLEADNKGQAVQQLKSKGFIPLEVKPTVGGAKKGSSEAFWNKPIFQPRVSKIQVASMSRQLSTLLNAGMTLESSLQSMSSQGKGPLVAIISTLKDRLREGADFAQALSEWPKVFSATFVTMVRAGEASGTLDMVMERIADHMESQVKLSRKVKSALAYPVLMLIVGVGIVVFLLTFVIPKVTQIFADLGRELPLPTQILLNMSSGLRNYWLFIALGLVLVGFSVWKFINTKKGKRVFHRILFHLPIFGHLYRMLVVEQTLRTLGMLLKNGVTLVAALDIVKSIATNVLLVEAITETSKGVQEGQNISDLLADSFIFPHIAIQMVAAGEKSGRLEDMLLIVSDDCASQLDAKMQMLTSLMEPIMILLLGGLVGFVVLAIILPIFEMNTLVG